VPIDYVVGDIFSARTQTIVNTVNTKGVMGKGLALAFKKRFPAMFQDYKERCARGEVRVGNPYLYKPSEPIAHWILNFPTKDHWRRPSRIEWIRSGLEFFIEHYADWGVTSIAFPQLGTLNGKLAWEVVRPQMDELLAPLPIDVLVYSFGEEPTTTAPIEQPLTQQRLL
jgi:O-acetyl-ADP-ribose deacetylase (regulator of RNase III)